MRLDYFPHSVIIHASLLFLLLHTGSVNTSGGIPVEIKIIENGGKVLLPTTPRKPLKSGKPISGSEKGVKVGTDKPNTPSAPGPEVDINDYAMMLKRQFDPIWYSNIQEFRGRGHKFYTEVLIRINKDGKILQVGILTSSGFKEVDQIAVNTFREVGQLPPNPPAIAVTDGIIWEFSAQ